MSNRYTTVIFDADGTLIGTNPDSSHGFEMFFVHACRELGKEVKLTEVKKAVDAISKKADSLKKSGCKRFCSPEQDRDFWLWFYKEVFQILNATLYPEKAAQLFVSRFQQGEFIQVYKDTRPCLETLNKRGIKLGVMSNFSPQLEQFFKKLNIHHYFDFFVVSSLVGYEKPEPEIFTIALEKAGQKANDILYVGDNPEEDILPAQNIGLDAILVNRFDRYKHLNLRKINNLLELINLFKLD